MFVWRRSIPSCVSRSVACVYGPAIAPPWASRGGHLCSIRCTRASWNSNSDTGIMAAALRTSRVPVRWGCLLSVTIHPTGQSQHRPSPTSAMTTGTQVSRWSAGIKESADAMRTFMRSPSWVMPIWPCVCSGYDPAANNIPSKLWLRLRHAGDFTNLSIYR